jgi:mono/diheme cytochrome c family protein
MPQSNSMRSFVPLFFVVASVVPLLSLHAQTAPATSAAVQAGEKPKASSHKSGYGSEGERIYAQNCSRCHTAPDGFSPHISGTVVLHMRVRASLSKHDEQELIRFFNP